MNKNRFNIIRIGVLFLIGVFILGKTSYVNALDPPSLSLAFGPDSFTLSEDHAFSFDLIIDSTASVNFGAMEIHLIYDPDLISITSIVPNSSGKTPILLYNYVVSLTPPDHLVTRIIGLSKSPTGPPATVYRKVATINGQGNLNNASTSLRATIDSYYTILGQYNSNNNSNSFSSLGSMVVFSPVPAPAARCGVETSSASFNWPAPTGVVDYHLQVYNKVIPQIWYHNGWTGGSTPSYVVDNIAPGDTVYARVGWTSGFPYSSNFSREGRCIMPTATPTPTPTPTPLPTIYPPPTSDGCTDGKATFSWSSQNGATNYQLQVFDNASPSASYVDRWIGTTIPSF